MSSADKIDLGHGWTEVRDDVAGSSYFQHTNGQVSWEKPAPDSFNSSDSRDVPVSPLAADYHYEENKENIHMISRDRVAGVQTQPYRESLCEFSQLEELAQLEEPPPPKQLMSDGLNEKMMELELLWREVKQQKHG